MKVHLPFRGGMAVGIASRYKTRPGRGSTRTVNRYIAHRVHLQCHLASLSLTTVMTLSLALCTLLAGGSRRLSFLVFCVCIGLYDINFDYFSSIPQLRSQGQGPHGW